MSPSALTFLVLLVAAFFAGMGAFALARPERVLAIFGTQSLTTDGRNEVRAVYGGFGLAIAALLFAALRAPAWAPGAFLAVAVALFGMAGGRLVSIAIDRSAGRYPWLFAGIEILLGVILMLAFLESAGG